jgi:K+ transporter
MRASLYYSDAIVTPAISVIQHIAQDPSICQALNPARAASFLHEQRISGSLLTALGAIVLSITGAEALYADMGHFGREPVHAAWLCHLCVVLPDVQLLPQAGVHTPAGHGHRRQPLLPPLPPRPRRSRRWCWRCGPR